MLFANYKKISAHFSSLKLASPTAASGKEKYLLYYVMYGILTVCQTLCNEFTISLSLLENLMLYWVG